ncbi:hypothetical protein HDU93_009061, partial [Gonapodya sp. JEL0774]
MRINYVGGTKILALKSDGLPRSFDAFQDLIVSKVAALESTDKALLKFTYLDIDGVTNIDVEDDGDVGFMLESLETSDSVVVNVSDPGALILADSHLQNFRQPVRAPPSPASTDAASSLHSQSQSSDTPPRRQDSLLSLARSSSASSPTGTGTQGIHTTSVPLNIPIAATNEYRSNRNEPDEIDIGVGDGILVTLIRDDYWAHALLAAASTENTDRIRVAIGGKEHVWSLSWRNERLVGVDQLLGALGTSEWSVQRGWGYKQIQNDPAYWYLKYVPREQDVKKHPESGYVQFTIFYNDKTLFTAANSKLREKVDNLSNPRFFEEFLERLRSHKDTKNVVTEWACIEPPAAYVGPHAGKGDLHVAFVVKQQWDILSGKTAKTISAWVQRQLVSGDW